MISAIAIDDEPLGLQVIKEYCSRLDFIDLKETFTKAGKGLDYLHQHKIDLIFLDIEMPLISGLDFCRKMPEYTSAIFTTAYAQYAVDGFNLNAVDYLLKPFDFDRFEKAVAKAKDYIQLRNLKQSVKSEHLFIKVDYGFKKIPLTEVLYIEAEDNYLKIHLDNGKYYLVRMALKYLLQQLSEEDFVRVHRSYVVASRKVTGYRNKTIYLGNTELPASALYMDNVNRMLGTANNK